MRLRGFAVLAMMTAFMLSLVAYSASAHVTPDSQVTLRTGSDRVVADIIIPASEYAYASGNMASNDAASLDAARSYLASRVALSSPSGAEWEERIDALRFATVAGPEDLLATMTFTVPQDARGETFRLDWSPVLEETADHFATVLVAEGSSGQDPELVGLLRQGDTRIDIAYGRSTFATRFGSAMWLGIEHILGGIDHLAFLLVLLLAAPLIAQRGRWQRMSDRGEAVRALVILATGFTIGHSLTLIGVVATGLTLPGSVVEPAIALTVLITAIHAIRPLFAGRELLVATTFGLIHGLGFAGFIQQTEAQVGRSIATLAGFNVGIEIVQVALLAMFVPLLFLLQRRNLYAPVRLALAVGVAALSVYWIVSRLGLLPG